MSLLDSIIDKFNSFLSGKDFELEAAVGEDRVFLFKLNRKLNRILRENREAILSEFSNYYLDQVNRIFTGQGIRDGEGDLWPPRQPYWWGGQVLPPRPALIRTGRMRAGFDTEVTSRGLILVNDTKYWKYTEEERPVLLVTEADIERFKLIIRESLGKVNHGLE